MGLSFIDNKKWEDITRVEIFFCSHLYHTIIGREKEFVEWLNNHTTLKLNPNKNWEVCYEVCFYRDIKKYFHNKDKKIEEPWNYSNKRTIDLCLLSNDHIVVIEAKAHELLDGEQLESMYKDKDDIKRILRPIAHDVKVDLVLLHSSKYSPQNDLIKITWKEINSTFQKSKHFERADSIYND